MWYTTPETHAEMIKKKAASNKIIAQAKLHHWQTYVQDIGQHTKLTEVYAKIRKMKQKFIQPDPELKAGGRSLGTSLEKAEAFADTFASASNIQSLPEEVRQLRQTREGEGELPDPPADNTTSLNCSISRVELQKALSSIKKS